MQSAYAVTAMVFPAASALTTTPVTTHFVVLAGRDASKLTFDGLLPWTTLPPPPTRTLPDLSETCAFLGDAQHAAVLYERLAPFDGLCATSYTVAYAGTVSQSLGLCAMTMAKLDDAARHLEDAIEENRRLGARPYLAHAQRQCGEVLLRRRRDGDAERAVSLLTTALQTYRELGMATHADRASAVLDTLVRTDVLARDGAVWRIEWSGSSFSLPNQKGLLSELMRRPAEDIHVLELAGALVGRESSMPVLDAEAKASYRRRMSQLEADIQEAVEWTDPRSADAARKELDALSHELASAVGLGGRDRRTGTKSERARQSVTKAIRASIVRIEAREPSLAEHLASAIVTGTFCRYDPQRAGA